MKYFQYLVFLSQFLLSTSTANATFLTFELDQAKSSNLKGWKIYYATHVTDDAPAIPVSKDFYDGVVEFIGFSEADTEMDIAARPWGLYIKPYPGFEDTYWQPELTMYVPGSPPSEDKTVYFIVTATALDGFETDPSNVVPSIIVGPGNPHPPEVNYQQGVFLSTGVRKVPLDEISKPDGSYLRIHSIKQFDD